MEPGDARYGSVTATCYLAVDCDGYRASAPVLVVRPVPRIVRRPVPSWDLHITLEPQLMVGTAYRRRKLRRHEMAM